MRDAQDSHLRWWKPPPFGPRLSRGYSAQPPILRPSGDAGFLFYEWVGAVLIILQAPLPVYRGTIVRCFIHWVLEEAVNRLAIARGHYSPAGHGGTHPLPTADQTASGAPRPSGKKDPVGLLTHRPARGVSLWLQSPSVYVRMVSVERTRLRNMPHTRIRI